MRFDALSSVNLSRGPAEGSRAPVPVYSGDCSTSYNFLKLLKKRVLWRMTRDV